MLGSPVDLVIAGIFMFQPANTSVPVLSDYLVLLKVTLIIFYALSRKDLENMYYHYLKLVYVIQNKNNSQCEE